MTGIATFSGESLSTFSARIAAKAAAIRASKTLHLPQSTPRPRAASVYACQRLSRAPLGRRGSFLAWTVRSGFGGDVIGATFTRRRAQTSR